MINVAMSRGEGHKIARIIATKQIKLHETKETKRHRTNRNNLIEIMVYIMISVNFQQTFPILYREQIYVSDYRRFN